jgi:sulfate-transporting ATPase
MIEFLDAALLGLGAGAIYGLLAQGLVVVYRGSGVLNFAQGAFATLGAYLFYEFSVQQGLSVAVSIIVVVIISVVLGVLVQLLLMHPMRRAAALVRIMATLGLLIVIESLIEIHYGPSILLVGSFLPTSSITFIKGMYIGANNLWIFVIGGVLTAGLWALYRFTSFGRTTQAVAEAPRVAAMLGHSPNRIAAINWGIGCGLAGLAGCLIAPLTGLQPSALSDLVIPAIAAAVIAQLRSFPGALAAGLGVGIIEAEVSQYVTQPGWSDAVPFLLIAAVLVVRGTSLPLRGHVLQRLPKVSSGQVPRRYLAAVLAALLLLVNFASPAWAHAVVYSALAAIVGLSVVVVTGYAGQISLAPYGMAAVGGLAAAQLSHHLHVSLVPALAFGAAVGTIAGAIIALPAIRTRGVNLAIITLGFGVVISDVILNNQNYSGGISGVRVGKPSLFGWSVSSTTHFARYGSMIVVVLVAMILLTLNVRRGASGRRMIAVRDNERAAASVGVRVASVKLRAFALSSFIAAVGGVLTVFQYSQASFQYGFDDLSSITLVGLVVLGGLGYASGAVFGALLVAGGVFTQIFAGWQSIGNYLSLIGGLAIIVQLLTAPDGAVPTNLLLFRSLVIRFRGTAETDLADSRRPDGPAAVPGATGERRSHQPRQERARPAPLHLEVRGLRVAFGGVAAVDGIDFDVAPGEVVGLIGPNGAGKTTAIDAVTGFVRSQGTITLGGRRVDGARADERARRGLARSFQSPELFDDLSVRENLAVACESSSIAGQLRDLVIPRSPVLSAAALSVVGDFQLTDVLGRKPAELSFAQRRLIGIARSAATAPSVLLLDEPGAGLDAHEIHELAALVRTLADDWGMGVVLVEHHLEMVASICDRLVVLDRGRVLAQGTPQQMLADEQVRAAYTGVRVAQGEPAAPARDREATA